MLLFKNPSGARCPPPCRPFSSLWGDNSSLRRSPVMPANELDLLMKRTRRTLTPEATPIARSLELYQRFGPILFSHFYRATNDEQKAMGATRVAFERLLATGLPMTATSCRGCGDSTQSLSTERALRVTPRCRRLTVPVFFLQTVLGLVTLTGRLAAFFDDFVSAERPFRWPTPRDRSSCVRQSTDTHSGWLLRRRAGHGARHLPLATAASARPGARAGTPPAACCTRT